MNKDLIMLWDKSGSISQIHVKLLLMKSYLILHVLKKSDMDKISLDFALLKHL